MKNKYQKTYFSIFVISLLISCSNKIDPDYLKNTYKLGKDNFNTISIEGGYTFPSGHNDTDTAFVKDPFELAETELTFSVWNEVREWAIESDLKYEFSNPGRKAGFSFSNKKLPVVYITYYDAAVWCNALTEYFNFLFDENTECCYLADGKPLRSSISRLKNQLVINYKSAGWRLPDFYEYELASRIIADKNNNGILEYGEYYPANHASGADGSIGSKPDIDLDNDGDIDSTKDVARYNVNSSQKVHPVKSRKANYAGFYDLSGNVYEWTNTQHFAKERIKRGGCFYNFEKYIQVSDFISFDENSSYKSIGMRIARTEEK